MVLARIRMRPSYKSYELRGLVCFQQEKNISETALEGRQTKLCKSLNENTPRKND